MDADLSLTIGIILSALSLSSLLSAYVENRPPRVGAILLITGITLISFAVLTGKDSYALPSIPRVMASVFLRLF